MKYLLILSLAVLLTCMASAQQIQFSSTVQSIYAKDAAHHIGEMVDVKGKLYNCELVTIPANNRHHSALLYVGKGAYPGQALTIIIEDATELEKLITFWSRERLIDEPVYLGVEGKLFMYQGKPAIELPDNKELGVLSFKDAIPSPNLL